MHPMETEALEWGITKIHVPGLRQGQWTVVCSECGDMLSHGWNKKTGPEMMVRNLRKQGWLIDGKDCNVCPDCQKEGETSDHASR